MKDENGGAVVAVVGGGSAMARQAVEAVLMAAGLELGAPTAAGAVVLVDPTEEEWGQVDRLRAHCVLVTTDPLDADGVLAAVLRGADAVLEADAPSEMLTHAVRVVC